ncbi:hypothetical protein VKT23_010076 [Stygiomarasmius scandens]|uniref:Uncharacterized protein n=1 Tax=Marasmiellus scandens TaxID=2682957 RepID=A0ABR1JD04_9AGAR
MAHVSNPSFSSSSVLHPGYQTFGSLQPYSYSESVLLKPGPTRHSTSFVARSVNQDHDHHRPHRRTEYRRRIPPSYYQSKKRPLVATTSFNTLDPESLLEPTYIQNSHLDIEINPNSFRGMNIIRKRLACEAAIQSLKEKCDKERQRAVDAEAKVKDLEVEVGKRTQRIEDLVGEVERLRNSKETSTDDLGMWGVPVMDIRSLFDDVEPVKSGACKNRSRRRRSRK